MTNSEGELPPFNDEDPPPPSYNQSQTVAEVNPKSVCLSNRTIFLIIFASLCILVGLIDMIVFYVVPNNEIKESKKKYPNFEFKKPKTAIVAIHFLLHINLIIIGPILLSAIDRKFCQTTTFLLLIAISGTVFGVFYVLEFVFSIFYIDMIKEEDFKLNQIYELLNSSNPINSMFFYVEGKVLGKKGRERTCYSKNGFALPIKSTLYSPYFDPDEYNPDYFYLKITQKVNMTNELFQYVENVKQKLISCEDRHNAIVKYYPNVEGEQVILHEGKKIPYRMKMSNMIPSFIFGLGIYPELLTKSIPYKSFEQNIFADIVTDFNYSTEIAAIDCSYIGKCKSKNPVPKM